ncbi:MAG: hypothetical protein J6112_06275 [Clostridia bacterium]|nr:hypothetical protein [Clostridia bacterium]
MDLELLYRQVKEAVSTLDFNKIWPGFEPLKFALYDNEKCFFDGQYIEKTDAFCANTSINFQGEQIAIWMAQEELKIPVLASKLVHEMFHGYQTLKGWDCWPDEMEALYRYKYDAGNLSLKLGENELLISLLESFDGDVLKRLLSSRKYRRDNFGYEFSYETKVEEIEGTANYVEWQVLKQLDSEEADRLTAEMSKVMTTPEHLFPIRISCYFTGALMINALVGAGVYSFDTAKRPVIGDILDDGRLCAAGLRSGGLRIGEVTEAINAFNGKTREIIEAALERNEIVLNGPLELVYVNIYNARHLGGFLTSTYFLAYREENENKTAAGDFVILMRDEKTIDKVYLWQ